MYPFMSGRVSGTLVLASITMLDQDYETGSMATITTTGPVFLSVVLVVVSPILSLPSKELLWTKTHTAHSPTGPDILTLN